MEGIAIVPRAHESCQQPLSAAPWELPADLERMSSSAAKTKPLPRIAFDAPACVDGMHERRARLPKRAYLIPSLLSRDEATLVRRLAESDPTADSRATRTPWTACRRSSVPCSTAASPSRRRSAACSSRW